MNSLTAPYEEAPSFNQQSAGLWNRRLILSILNDGAALSRRQLAERTGILGSTVAYIVRDLLEAGLLKVEGKERAAGVGRRNILLGINRKYGWGAGISLLNVNSARIEILDAGLRKLDATTFLLDPEPDQLPRQLAWGLESWLERRGRPPGKFLGVGVGLPGIVDVKRNLVLTSLRYGYRDFPLGSLLEELFEAPAIVDHNADLAAYAEKRHGGAAALDSFVYLLMNRARPGSGNALFSFGAALYLGGEVYRGACFAAGELSRANIPRMDLSAAEADELMAALSSAEEPLAPTGAELAKSLARYLVPIADLLDPEAIILGGDQPVLNRAFLTLVEEWVRAEVISLQGRRIRMLPSTLGSAGVARGAALRIVESGLYGRELEELGRSGVRR